MANTAVQPGAIRTPLSLPARFFGIITSPRATYESVVANPKWLGMLALDRRAHGRGGRRVPEDEGGTGSLARRRHEQSDGRTGQRAATPGDGEDGARTSAISRRASSCSLTPIFLAVISGILFAVFNAALGGEATLQAGVHGGRAHRADRAARAALHRPAQLRARHDDEFVEPWRARPVGALGRQSFAAHLLGAIDIFLIWQLFVLSIGLAVLYRRRTQPIATSLFVLYAVIAVIVAFVRRGAGA